MEFKTNTGVIAPGTGDNGVFGRAPENSTCLDYQTGRYVYTIHSYACQSTAVNGRAGPGDHALMYGE
ncbi:hypothetical protein I5907_07250 [Panacibacter sp. DH6]|uniref:Uncharacterized protein n=2 Tax=Panacibacter microcysteis TaxID=2793269 RepID=A0A931E6F9_9BACT|nr:hypothetical protein [Panacibacter microcysteis]MBG9376024.1 hypothetical protein [Panacibacter microcysteis]